jgi:hypothetical protein
VVECWLVAAMAYMSLGAIDQGVVASAGLDTVVGVGSSSLVFHVRPLNSHPAMVIRETTPSGSKCYPSNHAY